MESAVQLTLSRRIVCGYASANLVSVEISAISSAQTAPPTAVGMVSANPEAAHVSLALEEAIAVLLSRFQLVPATVLDMGIAMKSMEPSRAFVRQAIRAHHAHSPSIIVPETATVTENASQAELVCAKPDSRGAAAQKLRPTVLPIRIVLPTVSA